MHSYIGDFENLLGRIQETSHCSPGMAELGDEEQRIQKAETLTPSGMQHVSSAVSTQPIGQPPSPESSKDGSMVINDCNDGSKGDDFGNEENEEEDDVLTEDAAHSVMEAIWTEAEALVEAEARAEDDAWAKLTTTIEVCVISACIGLRLKERGFGS